MTSPNKQTPMMYVRKANVERMMMQESDFVTMEMYMQHLHKQMKMFRKKSKQIAKMADELTKDLEKGKAMKLKNDAKELFDEISDVLGDDTPSPSPRFSPKKSPSKSPKRSPKKSPSKSPKRSPKKSPSKSK